MLHVLVEAEATERAPLWLREGLVEVLAGETGAGLVRCQWMRLRVGCVMPNRYRRASVRIARRRRVYMR